MSALLMVLAKFLASVQRFYTAGLRPSRRARGLKPSVFAEVMLFESRVLLSASTLDVTRGDSFFYNPGGSLSAASTQAPEQIALSYVRSHYQNLGLQAGDVNNLAVVSVISDSSMSHVYLRQTYQGLQVMTADLSVTLQRDGRVLAIGSRFVSGLSNAIGADSITVSASSAISSVAGYFETSSGASSLTNDPHWQAAVNTQLTYYPGEDGLLHLAWKLKINSEARQGELYVDANSGGILGSSKFSDGTDFVSWAAQNANAPPSPQVAVQSNVPLNMSAESDTYFVYALPTKNPDDGPRVLVVNPADPTYSPYGWQDDDGVAGAEYTKTQGNNADAHLNRFDDQSGYGYGYQADGGVNRNFVFPMDDTQDPFLYPDAALAQVFYTVNMAHDIFAYYGFDEASGNFQQTNYTGQGWGGDPIQIYVQSVNTTNNARMYTPGDGGLPTMELYFYTKTDPRRDTAMENTIVIHEFGHGLTRRLTGGAMNPDVLDLPQSAAMGEGWSDFFALMLTQKPTDTPEQPVGLGTYVYGTTPDQGGGRSLPYSYDLSVNPLNYDDYGGTAHGSGEIWASALWDLNWTLIEKYGYSSDLKTGNAGNNLAMQLVIDALKIQPTNPTYLDGRNAILAADIARTGGANQAAIWEAFARRGMGYSATDGGSPYARGTAAFDVPTTVGTATFHQPSYLPGIPITITVLDGSFPGMSVPVFVTTSTGDSQQLTLGLQSDGSYQGTLTTSAGSAVRENGVLEIAPGTDIVLTYLDANSASSTPAVPTTVFATATVPATVSDADFDDGSGHSSPDGITLDNTPPSGSFDPGLWHITDGRGSTPGHSPGFSLYYGAGESADGGGSYDGPKPTQGDAITQAVVIPPQARLSFNYLMDRETNRGKADYTAVMISTEGGPFRVLAEKLPITLGKFQKMDLDLSEYAGQSARFAFRFNTIDAQENNHEGWYVDDIVVSNPVDGDDKISSASPLSVGTPVIGKLLNPTIPTIGDVDLYRLNVQAGATLEFDFDALETNLDGAFRLFDANGNVLAFNNNGAAPGEADSDDPFLKYTFTASGTYYLGVSGSTNIAYNPLTGNGDVGGGEGLYRLQVTSQPTILGFSGAASFQMGGSPINLGSGATIIDPDAAHYGGGTLTVAISANAAATDRHSIQPGGSGSDAVTVTGDQVMVGGFLIASFTGGNGQTPLVLHFNDEATPLRVQTLLRALTFSTATGSSTAVRTVEATLADGNGRTSDPASKQVDVLAILHGPISISLSSTSIVENKGAGIVVGTLSATDADGLKKFSYALVSGTGSNNNASFRIVGNTLKTATAFNYEVQQSYEIRLRATNQRGLSFEKTFVIKVTNVNEKPLTLALSANRIAENQPVGTSVGTLSATDPDAGSTFQYTLVRGSGSADNASFKIVNNELRTATPLNYELRRNYTVRVRVTDQSGAVLEKAFVIDVTNVEERPQNLALSATTIAENRKAGSVVGTLTATNAVGSNKFKYALVSGSGSADNASFTISGNQLKTKAVFNYESKASYSIRVRVTDNTGLTLEKVFTIAVTNVNEKPQTLALSATSIEENKPAGTVVGIFSATDPDAGSAFKYELVSGKSAKDNARFTISGNQLKTTAAFNFEARSSYSIRVRVTDNTGLIFEKVFTIKVTNVSE